MNRRSFINRCGSFVVGCALAFKIPVMQQEFKSVDTETFYFGENPSQHKYLQSIVWYNSKEGRFYHWNHNLKKWDKS